MTQTIRAITPTALPAAKRYSLSNVTVTTPSTTVPLDISLDRTVIYGNGRSTLTNVLRKSADAGRNWTDVRTFASNETVQGVITLANGELLVATGLSAAANVYKTSGWVANPATATFNLKLTTRGGSFANMWGFNQKGVSDDGVVFISTYNGGQTASGSTDTAQIAKARYAYLSLDFGETFNLIYDVYLQPQAMNIGGCHLHSSVYDKANDRLVLTFGDSTGGAATIAGTGNMFVAITDDFRANPTAPTWSYIPIPSVLAGSVCQYTSVMATPNGLILLPDPPGTYVTILPRTGYRTYGSARLGMINTLNGAIGKYLDRPASSLPILAAYNTTAGYYAGGSPVIQASPDGFTWYPLYKDVPQTDRRAFANNILVTAGGELVTDYAGGIFRATLVAPTA